ncbi:putative VTC domain-containing protein [Rosellinia necatrix]|uniref:Putative VTC domain-containing protein n=1 Tax=Rosellinia necatrix TaxID=77044 RepID=A0A1W2TIG7_ROSNE|nr:putative VTC domain-containing protein [Rosellinia necatrix]
MRFGKTLRGSIYPPWKDEYIDYPKLKGMLRENTGDDDDAPWTEDDENRFCDEIFNVQLDKVSQFQAKRASSLQQRADAAFEKLRELAPSDDKPKSDTTNSRLEELRSELDTIVNEVKELKKYSNLNYTGFLKIAKKHDRKRGDRYKVRPMMRVSLSEHGLNSEQGYSPLLNKLSLMYYAINQTLDKDKQQQLPDLEYQEEVHNGERYTAHKFWVHPDNLLEVKTAILRHLPALVYSQQAAKELDGNEDPKITSLYFDNPKFALYGAKVSRQVDASSVRLRWYGQLNEKPDIMLEQKVVYEDGTSEEKRFNIKDKYTKQYLDGEYKMEKSIQKMERQRQQNDSIGLFKATAEDIQNFIVTNKLQPVMRANYTRTAFQKPADDRVRISIDTDIAFIREDTLDRDRPCRDPAEWHRTDIDNSNMTYPFKNINQSEVSRFPYAVLEIKSKEQEGRKRPRWIDDLIGSHLVYATPKFSKFVHGVASLFEDYVNNLPFWLSDLETDIRKDPHKAHEEEEQRRARQAEDALAVDNLLGTSARRSSYRTGVGSPVAKSYLSERAASEARTSRMRPADESSEMAGEADDENVGAESGLRRGYGTLSSVFPGFSLSRYAQNKRQKEQLPKGVTKPDVWLKNMGPLQIEPKVWLANERTFLKWQHICVLLGTLALGLYTAAGENLVAECMGIAYIVIAISAGLWGNMMLHRRRAMIIERSGKDFDNMIGPLLISVALMVALILNFVFAYRNALGKFDGPIRNETETAFIGELL